MCAAGTRACARKVSGRRLTKAVLPTATCLAETDSTCDRQMSVLALEAALPSARPLCCQNARSSSSTACFASSRHSSICFLKNRSNAGSLSWFRKGAVSRPRETASAYLRIARSRSPINSIPNCGPARAKRRRRVNYRHCCRLVTTACVPRLARAVRDVAN